MHWSSIILIFAVTLISGLLALRLASQLKNWIKFLLSFSGAFLFGLTISHLLPEVYAEMELNKLVPIYILAGFFLQLLLEHFSQGIEHGHIHVHENEPLPVMLFVALVIHALLEGALLSNHGTHDEMHSTINYLFGLSIHKIPIAVILAIVLRKSSNKISTAILLLTVFALATPVGTLISGLVPANTGVVLMAMVAGSFLHISTTILFESTPNHTFNLIKFMVAICGAGAALLL